MALHTRPTGPQGVFQAIRGVGVVHQHRRLLGPTGHPLHTARHPLKLPQARQQGIKGDALLQQHTYGLEQIHQIEAAHQGGLERRLPQGGND